MLSTKTLLNAIMNGLKNFVEFVRSEIALFLALVLLVFLFLSNPTLVVKYPSFVDWKTIKTLLGLLVITAGLEKSGCFLTFSKEVLKRIKNERGLSISLVVISVILSTFLTNDITLFVVVPLTLGMRGVIKNSVDKLIVFEAIAVNVGSALTPIGNPQNLFLWHSWGISFLGFVSVMTPLVGILSFILSVFTIFSFKTRKIEFLEKTVETKVDVKLFCLSIFLLTTYVFSLEIGYSDWVLVAVLTIFVVFYRNIILRIDWLLLVFLVVIFIDFRIISSMQSISHAVESLNLQFPQNVFLFSSLVSQVISNVPASIFVSKFSHDWHSIAYGVNVGGNGLVISSLANVIALRMFGDKKIWLDFHKYSILYFLATIFVVYLVFYCL